jgi:hypothetical protein
MSDNAACALHGIPGCGSCFADTQKVQKEVRTRYVPPHLRGQQKESKESAEEGATRRSLEELTLSAAQARQHQQQQPAPADAELQQPQQQQHRKRQTVQATLQKLWNCKKGDLVPFKEDDPYNPGTSVAGWLCTKQNHAFDNLCITSVRGVECEPQQSVGQPLMQTSNSLFVRELQSKNATGMSLFRNLGGVLITVFSYQTSDNTGKTALFFVCFVVLILCSVALYPRATTTILLARGSCQSPTSFRACAGNGGCVERVW